MGSLRRIIVCGALLFALGAAPAGQPAPATAPVVYTAVIDGIIHPIAVEYVRRAVALADAGGASLLVISLRTPGGLVDSTYDINTAIISARTPVVVFVEPSGARAASAGFLITLAADVVAMAPGTHIGAAHPVAGGGEKVDDTMSRKIVSDVAAHARTLAERRKRNVELAELAVTESRTFTETEALGASPPLIDIVAADMADLLAQLDGREVLRFDGRTETLRTADATFEHVEQTWSQRVLGAIAHPQIAYLLLSLGILGLTIELWNPGAIFPGVVGGICLLLAFFALQVLPVNATGILLILLGVVLLILEVKVTSFGLLAVGGVLSLFFGSLMLIDSPLPEMQIGLGFILPVTLGVSFLLLFLVRLAVRAQQQRAVTGNAGMLDQTARALTAFEPGGQGRVQTRGEIWSATADEPIQAGEVVRVTGVSGLVLVVRPERRASGPSPSSTV
jgi:membrane-bound serine protease (ClpP class)